MLPQKTTTIEQFVESGNGITLSYFNLSFLDMISNGTWVAIRNTISDYIHELKNAAVNVDLTQEQQFAYFYKPKLLCYYIYCKPQLYFIILLMNDMADVKEFTKPIIKMLKKEHMSELMGYIYNAETAAMRYYNNKSE